MFPIKKISRKKWIFCLALILVSALAVIILYLPGNDRRKFQKLSQNLFVSELCDNTLSLHYTLAYPENYGLDTEAVLPSYTFEEDGGKSQILATLNSLSQISPEHLSEDDAYTYHLLVRYLNLRLRGTDYPFYSEPFSPSSGMQSGLPILLADYTFRSTEDVEDYLKILDQTDTYFDGLIQYEKEKASKGLFMSDTSAQKLVQQCSYIMDKEVLSSEEHFLHTTFEERLNEMLENDLINEEQKNLWLSENDRLLTTVMEPAYERCADAFTLLQGSGTNNMGLYYLPEGSAYYEYLLASTTGSARSIKEIKSMLFHDFQQNYSDLLTLLSRHTELTSSSDPVSVFPYSDPEEMLTDLQDRMSSDFPSFPTTENFVPACTIKSVSPAMEDYCSPAYYLTPPIDDMSNNIIYINHKNSPDALTLYTTLAHEGYPGHLYQTVYSQLYMNRQDTSPIRYLLHYGGYVEGWALYVENLSYYYAQTLVEETDPSSAAWFEACRLNRNLQLCLFSLIDIAIHYEGATPSQISAILRQIGINDPNAASAVYQYIVEEPATYPKYYLGFLEFLSLKEDAQKLWGKEFSLKQFHRFILEMGPSDFQGLSERLHSSSIISSR